MTVKKETAQIRPFVVCAILRNVPRALVLVVFWKRFFLGRRLGPPVGAFQLKVGIVQRRKQWETLLMHLL